MVERGTTKGTDEELLDLVEGWVGHPYKFAMQAFPWGEEGTVLEKYPDGPDTWQREVLQKIEDGQLSPDTALKIAVASGHGVGKSALVSIVILYCMNTMPHLNGIVTANTEDQLKTKTFYELNKWYDLMLTKHWFKCTGDKIYHLKYPKTWFCAAVNWSEDRTEAFAGQHAENVLVVYDEASAIPDSVWEVSEGAMTTPGAIWLAFGNPTRNDGRFYDCFESKYWDTMRVDSRTCKMTNKKQLAIWEEEYGEDSDFFRVRVRGLPPSKGDDYFFSAEDLR